MEPELFGLEKEVIGKREKNNYIQPRDYHNKVHKKRVQEQVMNSCCRKEITGFERKEIAVLQGECFSPLLCSTVWADNLKIG
jgi:hypothetical protein